jgi:hypothetical protein
MNWLLLLLFELASETVDAICLELFSNVLAAFTFRLEKCFESGNTIHVADVWESEEDLNDFVTGRLMQYIRNNKIPEPKVKIFQINDVSAFAGIDKYRV